MTKRSMEDFEPNPEHRFSEQLEPKTKLWTQFFPTRTNIEEPNPKSSQDFRVTENLRNQNL